MLSVAKIEPNRLYTIPTVAELLGVSVASVRAALNEKRLRARKLREKGHPRVIGQSIIDFLNEPQKGRTS